MATSDHCRRRFAEYGRKPMVEDEALVWRGFRSSRGDDSVRIARHAFLSPEGGFRIPWHLGRASR
jgi:phosphogluconate dehydratase